MRSSFLGPNGLGPLGRLAGLAGLAGWPLGRLEKVFSRF
jgi:hypothetical protein